eukprot:TRINITY_DN2577_c0_g1_i1.p1 TRINITY_DN2577_c0_g1~~TRINITY_DN2577_c0_g1_i1.p1  ORF type:complete len:223 (-),score=31.92 TRINITY_DN2577_c0_g1_i1:5-598(-)
MMSEFSRIRPQLPQLLGALRRPLHYEECKALQSLTAKGIAKINADVSRGVPIETTLDELLAVFRIVCDRRAGLVNQASALESDVLNLLATLRRPARMDEIWMLLTHPLDGPRLQYIAKLLAHGDTLDDALEDVMLQFRAHTADLDAERAALFLSTRSSVGQLAPTRAPEPSSCPVADGNCLNVRHDGTAVIGPCTLR